MLILQISSFQDCNQQLDPKSEAMKFSRAVPGKKYNYWVPTKLEGPGCEDLDLLLSQTKIVSRVSAALEIALLLHGLYTAHQYSRATAS